ncbi:hypothetical protein LBMAG42_33040 [Deltaproteobacteria bacterium]|nr:hypothetical protein LBMAG42_33040 [Deltaproteobacteria bacterium]
MRGFPVDNFMGLRLAPDMLPFWRQVTIACDVAKAAAAAYAQIEAPKFDDNETTVAQLHERIAATRAFLASIPADAYAKTNDKSIVSVPFPRGKAMFAADAALSRSVPNFFFHVSMAYALLRAGGVSIGKMDYLGELNLFDA